MKRDGKNGNNRNEGKTPSHPSHSSHPSPNPDRLLPPRGDYQTLLSFKKAEVVYDFTFMDTRPPAVVANIAICLIHQTNYLIDKQLLRLEKDYLEQGGLRERMTRLRLQYRKTHPRP